MAMYRSRVNHDGWIIVSMDNRGPGVPGWPQGSPGAFRGFGGPMPGPPTNPLSSSMGSGVGAPRKRLDERSAGPAVNQIEVADIDLPLLAPTGPQASERVLNRQAPPPLEYSVFTIPPAPLSAPGAARVDVRGAGGAVIANTIAMATEGSLIHVPAGTYGESLIMAKSIHFIADGQVTIASDTITDAFRGAADLITFEGFTFTQDVSQSASSATVEAGTCVFRNCVFRSSHTVGLIVRKSAKCYLFRCRIEGIEATAVNVNDNATVLCEDCVFSAPQGHAVLVRGESMSRFSRCSVERCGRKAFFFAGKASFVVEGGTMQQPIEIATQASFGMLKGITFSALNLRITQGATPYIVGCTFDRVSLECRDNCGVRLIDCHFTGQTEQPGLIVYGDATVTGNECEFKNATAGAGAAVYQRGALTLTDSRFVDLAGVGVLAFGQTAELDVERSAFSVVGGAAILAHTGVRISVTESLVDRAVGSGVQLIEVGSARIVESEFAGCGRLGVEVTSCDGLVVDHCIFEGNTHCGLLGIGSRDIRIGDSDFTRNRMAGLDLRECDGAHIATSIAVDNTGGGYAFRSRTRVTIEGGGVGANQQFGVMGCGGATVSIHDVKLTDNEGLAVLACDGCDVTMTGGEVSAHEHVAIAVEGGGTRATLRSTCVKDNGVGVQCSAGGMVSLEQAHLTGNGVHLEVFDGGSANAIASKFEQSRGGIGVSVLAGGGGSFTSECSFSDESKTAVANEAECSIVRSSISDCGTCGVFWHGQASGEVRECKLVRNGPCGIQLMGGQLTCSGNVIEGHEAFGIHVQPSAQLGESGNTFSQNAMKDVNHEH